MYIFLLIIHVIISVALVMIILAQSSKGGALDGLVGGTASTMLGAHGASAFLSKWTKILGAVWVISSLVLAMNVGAMTSQRRGRALQQIQEEAPAHVPPATDYGTPEEGHLPPVAPEEGTTQAQPAPETVPAPTE
ncbi:MAG: preprotein translocase subunit SecG [Candidatus Cloacimonetes bacterium]|nr:preprotein translocase subunit SecG [Candidatus Cloacimonadota bacterium]